MRSSRRFAPRARVAVLAALAACSSADDALDSPRQLRFATLQECFPATYPKLAHLLALAATWRIDAADPVPDPPGADWQARADGSLRVEVPAGESTLAMTMRFFSPAGEPQRLDLDGAASLNDAVRAAAAELRTRFGVRGAFVVGAWTLDGVESPDTADETIVTGSGALTGVFGGSPARPDLARLFVTGTTIDAGPPAVEPSTIALRGARECELRFRAADGGLDIDAARDQVAPIGTLELVLAGPLQVVTLAMAFRNTQTAQIVVDGAGGHFDYDLANARLTYRD